MVEMQFNIENPTLNGGVAAGLQGCSPGHPSNAWLPPSNIFTLNTATKTDLMPPIHSDWLWIRNYNSRNLPGIPGTDGSSFVTDANIPDNEYKVEFLLNQNLYATIIIYDR